jgi:hypothetical protein
MPDASQNASWLGYFLRASSSRSLIADQFATPGQVGEMTGVELCVREIKRNDRDKCQDILDERFAASAALGSISAFHADQKFGRGNGGECWRRVIREESVQIETPSLECDDD